MRKRVVALFLVWSMLIGGTLTANAQTISVTGDTASGVTPTSFTVTADMLEGGNLVVTVPTEMTLSYDAINSQFKKDDVINVKGNIDPSKKVEITTPTNVTYVHADDASIDAAGTVTFGTTVGSNQKTVWSAKELHDDIFGVDSTGGAKTGVSKPISTTVAKSEVEYIGSYTTNINYNIAVVDAVEYETLTRANISDWVEYNDSTNVATIKASRTVDGTTYKLNAIGSDAFGKGTSGSGTVYKSAMTQVAFPEGIAIKTIQDSAFRGCSNLLSINIPDSVETIGDNAFFDCTNLGSVTGMNSVKSIGAYAFLNTGVSSISLPATVQTLGEDSLIKSFDTALNVTYAGTMSEFDAINDSYHAFCDVIFGTGLPNTVSIKCSGGIRVYDSLYPGNTDFYSYSDDGKVLTISSENGNKRAYKPFMSLLESDSSVETVVINEGVTFVGYSAFNGCYSITTVHLPSTLTIASNETIRNCPALTDVYYNGTKEEWDALMAANHTSSEKYSTSNYTLHCSGGDTYSITASH